MKSHYGEYLQAAQRSYFIAAQKKGRKKRHKRGIAAVFFTLNTECNLGSVLVLISPQHPHLDSNQACAL